MRERFFKEGYGTTLAFAGILLIYLVLEYVFQVHHGLDSYLTLLMWIAVVAFAVIDLIVLNNFYQVYRAQQGFETEGKDIDSIDISDTNLSPPEKMQAHIQDFEALGLTPFAVIEGFGEDGNPRASWYWIDETHTTRAYLTLVSSSQRLVTAFISVLECEAVIETGYRSQIPMDADAYHLRTVKTSIADAYTYHQRRIEAYQARYGEPIPISSREMLLQIGNRLRKVNNPKFYAYVTRSMIRYLIAYLLIMLGFLLAIRLSPGVDLLLSLSIVGMMAGVCYIILYRLQPRDDAPLAGKKKKKNS